MRSGYFGVLPMIKRVFILHMHILRNNERAGCDVSSIGGFYFFSHFVFLAK